MTALKIEDLTVIMKKITYSDKQIILQKLRLLKYSKFKQHSLNLWKGLNETPN